jgi:hypothetical protein
MKFWDAMRSCFRDHEKIRKERDSLLLENAKLRSFLPTTADGVALCECQYLYCPKCGNEVTRATEKVRHLTWKCALCLPCSHAWDLSETLSARLTRTPHHTTP